MQTLNKLKKQEQRYFETLEKKEKKLTVVLHIVLIIVLPVVVVVPSYSVDSTSEIITTWKQRQMAFLIQT